MNVYTADRTKRYYNLISNGHVSLGKESYTVLLYGMSHTYSTPE